jgi:hypothetical protein
MLRDRISLLVFAVLVSVFVWPGPAGAGTVPPQGFRGLTWGAAPDQRLQAQPVTDSNGVTVYLPRAGKRPKPLLGIPVAEEAFSFSGGKFFSGSAWVDGKGNYTRARKAIEKKYGAPAHKAGHYDRDKLADENKSLAVWTWRDSPVEVRLAFNEQFARTTVTFLNRDMLADYRKQHSGDGGADAAEPKSLQPGTGPAAAEPAGQPASPEAAGHGAPASAAAQ